MKTIREISTTPEVVDENRSLNMDHPNWLTQKETKRMLKLLEDFCHELGLLSANNAVAQSGDFHKNIALKRQTTLEIIEIIKKG